jgi:glycerophosphoryl diester phosphodiesterase
VKIKLIFILISSVLLWGCAHQQMQIGTHSSSNKLVIAHRGASGYLPEHSIAAKAMAYAMGADYIEQDVVMTKDNRLVILHDYYLDRVTDVMTQYPKRFRIVLGQQRWFAIDFTLQEIKGLNMTEGFYLDKNLKPTSTFPSRFPLFKSSFKVSTLEQEIELIQGLNHSTGRNVGLYVEIKAPWFHYLEGRDISQATLSVLKKYGYSTRQHKIYIQCFDPEETQRIHDQLMPQMGISLKLVQLIAETDWLEKVIIKDGKPTPYDYSWMQQPGAMKKIASYADGIGPWKPMLVAEESTSDNLIITDMLDQAHQQGLVVHPYTFRKDPGRLPNYAKDFEDLLDIFFFQVGVDGVFTDFPDLAVEFLNKKQKEKKL